MAEQPGPSTAGTHRRARGHSQPARVQLTEEEKSVLLECRRNSIARGLFLGVPSVLVLRWFVRQGRAPRHVQRWTGLYYTGAFLGSFIFGVGSYKDACFQKIMALENSQLAKEVREHVKRRKGHGSWHEDSESEPGPESSHRRHRRYPPRHPHTPPPPTPSPLFSSSQMERYSDSYSGEGVSGGGEFVPPEDQPDAFGGATTTKPTGSTYTTSPSGGRGQQEAPPTSSRGRTFDDIREESRRRQLQQNYPQAGRREVYVEEDRRQRQTARGSGKPVRRNKYGDVIVEE